MSRERSRGGSKENYKPKYINSISGIPMFEQGSVTGKYHYNTTYLDEYSKKKKLNDNQIPNLPEFSTYQNYDYKLLSEKLENRNRTDMDPVRENRIINQYQSNSNSSLNDLTTETRTSFNGDINVYHRPKIPAYIRRDNFYQTNAEKNVAYLRAHDGTLLPFVPTEEERRGL